MRGEPVELPCPYCDRGKIQCWYIAGATSLKTRSTATFGKVKERTQSSDVWLIKSGCPACGKTAEEVEKGLKNKEVI